MMTLEELRALPDYYKSIQRDFERLQYLRELSTSLPPVMDPSRVPVRSSVQNKAMAVSDELIDLSRMLADEERELRRLEKEAEELIRETVEQEKVRKVLLLHYIRHLSFVDISDILHYSYRWIMTLKRRGLDSIRDREQNQVITGKIMR